MEKLSPLYDASKAATGPAAAPVAAAAVPSGPPTASTELGAPVAGDEGAGVGSVEVHAAGTDVRAELGVDEAAAQEKQPADVAASTAAGVLAGPVAASSEAAIVPVPVAGHIPADATTGLGGFERPRDHGVLRSDDPALHVGVLHVEPYLQPFPLLAHPWK